MLKNKTYYDKIGVNARFWMDFVRPNMLRLRGYKCEHCPSTEHLDVHHTDYNIQTIHTLKVLCKKCHKKEHKI